MFLRFLLLRSFTALQKKMAATLIKQKTVSATFAAIKIQIRLQDLLQMVS